MTKVIQLTAGVQNAECVRSAAGLSPAAGALPFSRHVTPLDADVPDHLSLSPFVAHAREDGEQELVFSDGDMVDVADVFDDRDAEPVGGHRSAARPHPDA